MRAQSFISYKLVILMLAGMLCRPPACVAYSVLTHEAIIDAAWDKTIRPLLAAKYPGATADQLKDAHAYAYGGCLIQDMGYYPFGNKEFSDLTHYVRTGDFIKALLEEARDLNEYAFAVGALCHYYADKYGHGIAVNHCVPMVFPKDKEKYGSVVTYEQDPVAHVRMEFGFDVLQTARGNYASDAYHGFIGFKVAKPLLERAFVKTYGIEISDLFNDFTFSVESFRWVIKNFFPTITKAAWAAKRSELRKSNPTITKRKFEYRMRNANYNHEFGKKHERPGIFPTALSLMLRAVPKVGPLKKLKIKVPGTDGEQLFIKSFDTVLVHYTHAVQTLHNDQYRFPNIDFDTGHDTWAGEYDLADKRYAGLLLRLKANNFSKVDAGLKQNMLQFYSTCNERMAAMAGIDTWQQVINALDSLKTIYVTQK
jgi:hypothetical protein